MSRRLHVDLGRSILDDHANSHNRLWPELAPVERIEPGQQLTLELRDGMDGRLSAAADSDALASIELTSNHPLTGPVEVSGAQPGDVVVIEPLAIEPRGDGQTAVIPGFGLLGDLFTRPFLVRWEIADGIARSPQLPGVAITGRPFLGCAAVAPSAELVRAACERETRIADRGGFALLPEAAGAAPAIEPYASHGLRTIPPRENGGNLDIPEVRPGSRLLLPVHVPGAMVSIGDPHFAQGEGECCGTAIEIAAEATVRIGLRKPAEGSFVPRFPAIERTEVEAGGAGREGPGAAQIITSGIPVTDDGENSDLDLTLAARQALLEMLRWLSAERGLSMEQGYVLASVAADLRIAEAVNRPNGLVICRLPLEIFEES